MKPSGPPPFIPYECSRCEALVCHPDAVETCYVAQEPHEPYPSKLYPDVTVRPPLAARLDSKCQGGLRPGECRN